jgi:tRNA uridine 5-carboxymethylaminomethyl modification enzyme
LSYKDLPNRNTGLSEEVIQQVEILVKYAGYLSRQEAEVNKLKSFEHKHIPHQFDYATVPSLRNEARQKLTKIRPATLGQASRISGVSPADISILMVWLKRHGTQGEQPRCAAYPERIANVEDSCADQDSFKDAR